MHRIIKQANSIKMVVGTVTGMHDRVTYTSSDPVSI